MFKPGDVVHYYSGIAGKGKYHLCISVGCENGVHAFLFINSEHKYEGDCIFDDGKLPGLPKSRTGLTIVGFSQIVRVKTEKMALWRPEIKGTISNEVAEQLLNHARSVRSLTQRDRQYVIEALTKILGA